MFKTLALSLLFVLAGFEWSVQAATPKTTTLLVDLIARQVFVDGSALARPLGKGYYSTVHADETTQIVIKRANPLLFNYKVNVVATPSESAAAVETFATAFGELLNRFSLSKGAGIAPHTVEGLDLSKFNDNIQTMFTDARNIGPYIDLSLDDVSLATLRSSVEGWPKDVDDTNSMYEKALQIHLKCMRGEQVATDAGPVPCSTPVNLTATLAERQAAANYGLAQARLEELGVRLAAALAARKKMQDATKAYTEANAAVVNAGTKATVAQKQRVTKTKTDLDAATAETTAAQASLDQYDAQEAVVTSAKAAWDQAKAALDMERNAAAASQTTIADFLRDALSIQMQVDKAGALVKGFAADVDNIEDRQLDPVAYSLDTSTVTISVAKESKYANYLSAKAKAEQNKAKDGVVMINPFRAASVRPGVAFVIGFLRNPDYSVVKSGDGFKITEKSAELTRFNVGAMINVIPRGWDEPTFGGFLQFGVSPKNDETAFFVGWGLQLESMLTFGAGAMIQQVHRLGAGQNPGDLLTSADDLVVNDVFKKALYIHATVALSKKK